jgi:hypothetical protein
MADVDIGTAQGAFDAVGVADVLPSVPAVSTMSVNPSVNSGISVADVVTTPTFTLKLFRGTNAVTVSLITLDWDFTVAYKQFANVGVPLKGIILMPGGTDTFSIKDGGENGAYLYYAAISTATVLVYPGSLVKPFIDFSECSLNAGHKITFVW